jgi:hypothetical protein
MDVTDRAHLIRERNWRTNRHDGAYCDAGLRYFRFRERYEAPLLTLSEDDISCVAGTPVREGRQRGRVPES